MREFSSRRAFTETTLFNLPKLCIETKQSELKFKIRPTTVCPILTEVKYDTPTWGYKGAQKELLKARRGRRWPAPLHWVSEEK